MATTSGRDPSLSHLEAEAEHTRAQLVQTVDELRSHVSDTVADIRHQASPAAIKEHAREYVRGRSQEMIESIERRARENPLQTAAIAAGIAYPIYKLIRAMPAPVLLIGAGIALAKPAERMIEDARKPGGALDQARERFEDATDAVQQGWQSASETVRDGLRDATHSVRQGVQSAREGMQSAASSMRGAMDGAVESGARLGSRISSSVAGASGSGSAPTSSSVASQMDDLKSAMHNSLGNSAETARGLASDAGASMQQGFANTADTARGLASGARDMASNASAAVSDAVSSGYRTGSDAVTSGYRAGADAVAYGADQASRMARQAQNSMSDLIQRNPLVVAGVGLVLGAALAAALPVSRGESRVLGGAAGQLKARAREAAEQGLETVKSAAGQIYEDTVKRAQEQGLDADSLKDAAQNFGDKVKTVVAAAAGEVDGGSQNQGGGSQNPGNAGSRGPANAAR